jgi:repressor LexA
MEPMSHIQRKMYDCIVRSLQTQGLPPTNREIGRELGISSTGHVDHHLNELEKKGWITRIPGKSRGIRLTQRPTGIPVKGAIAAGVPLDIYPDAPSLLRVDDSWIQAEESYALLVRGDSMIEDYICDGDYVIIQPAPTCRDGDIVVVTHLQGVVNGSATLKRFFLEREHDRVRLQPANSQMEPIFVSRNEWDREWSVQGKVIAILRHYQPSS